MNHPAHQPAVPSYNQILGIAPSSPGMLADIPATPKPEVRNPWITARSRTQNHLNRLT